ncbi:MAG TPA: glycosyltransferase family 9 protein, partial [Aquella sp.]|nr:glycosyltransferase family 9 protein [Aquella sp.]
IQKLETIFMGSSVNYIVFSKALHEYMILMSSCQLVICNDSGAAHIAGAYGVPELVIFGKGDPNAVKPFTHNQLSIISHDLECKPCHLVNCKFGTNQCMKMVSTDEVYKEASRIINSLGR